MPSVANRVADHKRRSVRDKIARNRLWSGCNVNENVRSKIAHAFQCLENIRIKLPERRLAILPHGNCVCVFLLGCAADAVKLNRIALVKFARCLQSLRKGLLDRITNCLLLDAVSLRKQVFVHVVDFQRTAAKTMNDFCNFTQCVACRHAPKPTGAGTRRIILFGESVHVHVLTVFFADLRNFFF